MKTKNNFSNNNTYFYQQNSQDNIEAEEEDENMTLILKNANIKENSGIRANMNIIDRLYSNRNFNYHQTKQVILTILSISLEGIHFYFISALLKPIKAHYNLSENEIDLLSSLVFLGFGLGAFLNGILLFYMNRKTLIISASIMVSIFLFILTLIYEFIYLLSIRFLIGFFIGMIVPTMNNILTEYLPTKFRGLYLTSVWAGFGLGQIILITYIYFIMCDFNEKKLSLLIKLLIPYHLVITILFIIFLEDSPRNLLSRNKKTQAFGILRRMIKRDLSNDEKNELVEKYCISRENERTDIKNNEDNLEISQLTNQHNSNNDNNNSLSNITIQSNLSNESNYSNNSLQARKSNMKEAFSSHYIYTIIILLFGCLLGALNLYGPMIIENLELDYLHIKKNTSESLITMNSTINTNSNETLDNSNYLNQIRDMYFIAITGATGNIIGGFLCEIPFIGRRGVFYYSSILYILNTLLFIFSYINYLIFSSIQSNLAFMFLNVYNIYCTEVVPTKIRDFAMGIIYSSMRFGGFSSQFIYNKLFNYNPLIPYVFNSFVCFLTIIVVCGLPIETYGRDLDNDINNNIEENINIKEV